MKILEPYSELHYLKPKEEKFSLTQLNKHLKCNQNKFICTYLLEISGLGPCFWELCVLWIWDIVSVRIWLRVQRDPLRRRLCSWWRMCGLSSRQSGWWARLSCAGGQLAPPLLPCKLASWLSSEETCSAVCSLDRARWRPCHGRYKAPLRWLRLPFHIWLVHSFQFSSNEIMSRNNKLFDILLLFNL